MFYNELTVKFKNGTPDKMVNLISLMTDARIQEKTGDNRHKFKIINDDGTKNYLSRYTELFSLITFVEKVESEQNFSFKEEKKETEVPGVLLVKFKKEASEEEIRLLNRKNNVQAELYVPALKLYKIIYSEKYSLAKILEIYQNSNLVEYAEPDRVMSVPKPVSEKQTEENFIKVIFKSGSEELLLSVFNLLFDTELSGKRGFSGYILKLPKNISPETAIRVFDLCPFIMNIETVKR